MTHDEMVTVFLFGNFREGDLLEITLNNGETVFKKLATNVVYFDEGENGDKINSRIGVLPPPTPKGLLAAYANIPTPIRCADIARIKKATT